MRNGRTDSENCSLGPEYMVLWLLASAHLWLLWASEAWKGCLTRCNNVPVHTLRPLQSCSDSVISLSSDLPFMIQVKFHFLFELPVTICTYPHPKWKRADIWITRILEASSSESNFSSSPHVIICLHFCLPCSHNSPFRTEIMLLISDLQQS